MAAETFGPWQRVSQCKNCQYIVAKDEKWMDSFFVPVCPNCGEYNLSMGLGLFRGRTARRVTTRWLGRFIRWEFEGGEG